MNLSIAKEYLLCGMNEKGSIDYSVRHQVCFTSSCLLELLYKDIIFVKDKKIYIGKELTEENIYLLPIYEFIKNSKPMRLEKVVDEYNLSFSNKPMAGLFNSVKNSLIQDGCTVKVEKNTLFGNKTYIKAKEESIDSVVQKVRAEILEDGRLDESTVILVLLLDKSELLKEYFSKYESDCLKGRLKEIRNNPNNKIISQLINYIEAVLISIII